MHPFTRLSRRLPWPFRPTEPADYRGRKGDRCAPVDLLQSQAGPPAGIRATLVPLPQTIFETQCTLLTIQKLLHSRTDERACCTGRGRGESILARDAVPCGVAHSLPDNTAVTFPDDAARSIAQQEWRAVRMVCPPTWQQPARQDSIQPDCSTLCPLCRSL